LSFNGDSRIQQLQDEVETLKDQLSRGADYAEVDKLKESLASIKKKSLKLENEKMALERSTKKAIEEMESRLEANTEELEYLRRNGGDETSQELEKLKKTAQKEKAALEGRIATLKEELSSKTDSLARIEKRLEVMEDELREAQNSLVGAQDAEARAVEELEKLCQRPPAENKDAQKSLDIAQEKVAALEADLSTAQRRLDTMAEELAQAKASAGLNRSTNTVPESAVSTSVAHLERTIRQLQREVSGLTREKAALQTSLQENDDLLAEKDEEIFALKTSIPIPPSPSATRSLDDSVVDHANLLAALETKTNELVSLRHEKAELQEKLRLQADQMAELTQRVYALQAELEVMQSDNVEVSRASYEPNPQADPYLRRFSSRERRPNASCWRCRMSSELRADNCHRLWPNLPAANRNVRPCRPSLPVHSA
jgi:chromosome segregation ATPase